MTHALVKDLKEKGWALVTDSEVDHLRVATVITRYLQRLSLDHGLVWAEAVHTMVPPIPDRWLRFDEVDPVTTIALDSQHYHLEEIAVAARTQAKGLGDNDWPGQKTLRGFLSERRRVIYQELRRGGES